MTIPKMIEIVLGALLIGWVIAWALGRWLRASESHQEPNFRRCKACQSPVLDLGATYAGELFCSIDCIPAFYRTSQ